MIYEFFSEDRVFLLNICSTSAIATDSDIIAELLNEFTRTVHDNSEIYLDDYGWVEPRLIEEGWIAFLRDKGYDVSRIKPDYSLYFEI